MCVCAKAAILTWNSPKITKSVSGGGNLWTLAAGGNTNREGGLDFQ